MGFNLFKKRAPEVQTIEVEKIVEKTVNVPVPSRFTFAHDEEVRVNKFIFNNTLDTKAIELMSNDKFVSFGVARPNGVTLYPVFRMPKNAATTRMTSPTRIICIGELLVDNDNAIVSVIASYAGMTMAEIMEIEGVDMITEDTMTTRMVRSGHIISDKAIEGDIDYQVFCDSTSIAHDLYWITNP